MRKPKQIKLIAPGRVVFRAGRRNLFTVLCDEPAEASLSASVLLRRFRLHRHLEVPDSVHR